MNKCVRSLKDTAQEGPLGAKEVRKGFLEGDMGSETWGMSGIF